MADLFSLNDAFQERNRAVSFAQDGKFSCDVTVADVGPALFFMNHAFGYMSAPEHYAAGYNRFGQNPFEKQDSVLMGGLIGERRDLYLTRIKGDTPIDLSAMSALEFLVTSDAQLDFKGCEVHSISYSGKPPFVVIRPETKMVMPETYGSMISTIDTLQSIRPVFETFQNIPGVTTLRP